MYPLKASSVVTREVPLCVLLPGKRESVSVVCVLYSTTVIICLGTSTASYYLSKQGASNKRKGRKGRN